MPTYESRVPPSNAFPVYTQPWRTYAVQGVNTAPASTPPTTGQLWPRS